MSKMGEEYNRRLEKYAPDLLEACREAKIWFALMEADIPIHTLVLARINKAIALVEEIEK